MSSICLNPSQVGVFCSSSSSVDQAVFNDARNLGRLLAQAGLGLVYGGTTCGTMGAISEAHKQACGRVIGVIPGFMIDAGIKSPLLDEVVVVKDMASRKTIMNRLSGAFVVLPGGIGTFDEFFDALALKQLEVHDKPIVLLNTIDYFNPLVEMIRMAVKAKTIQERHLQLFKVVSTPKEVIAALQTS